MDHFLVNIILSKTFPNHAKDTGSLKKHIFVRLENLFIENLLHEHYYMYTV